MVFRLAVEWYCLLGEGIFMLRLELCSGQNETEEEADADTLSVLYKAAFQFLLMVSP